MRRMLTEKDVEKIDSIDPADIETLKATGSPKDASSGYVLTADGNGKATYQYKSSGTRVQWQNGQEFSLKGLKTDADGNKYVEIKSSHGNTAIIFGPYMKIKLTANGVAILPVEYTLMIFKDPLATGVRIYFPDSTITKYNLTAETQFAGSVGYVYMYQ